MNEEDIIKITLEEGLYVHKTLGPGMLESVYKTCLAYRLRKRGLKVDLEKAIPVFFEEIKMDCGYRADLIVEDRVIVEIKNAEMIHEIFITILLTYLRFQNLRYGLILNFRSVLFKNGIKRVLNGY